MGKQFKQLFNYDDGGMQWGVGSNGPIAPESLAPRYRADSGMAINVSAYDKVGISYDIFEENTGDPIGTFKIQGEGGDGFYHDVATVSMTQAKSGLLEIDTSCLKSIRMWWQDNSSTANAITGYIWMCVRT